MSTCSQCGTAAKATDKFCNVCGTPLARPPSGSNLAAAPAPPQYPPGPPPPASPYAQTAAPPPPLAPYGAPPVPPARCQMGHELAPGATYCPQGHPIALDQMQFANDAYGAPPQAYAPQAPPAAYGAQPRPGPPGYAPQPPVQQGYAPAGTPAYVPSPAPPPNPYAPAPQPPPQLYAPPQAQGYGPAPQGIYAPHPGYGAQQLPPAPFQPEPPREAVPPKMLRGFLVAYGTNPSGDFWPLTGGRLVVGRVGAADGIDIPMQDPTISSRHAAMVVDAGTGSISVEDTGSTNGTFVNDEHIGFNGRRELRDGDRLRLGGFTAIVKVIGRV